MSSILKNTAVVAAFTSLSRVLGLVREMLQSRLIGAGYEQSAFALAFAIPNMARRMFGEGALTAAFVPVFKGELEADESLVRAKRLARAVLTMSLMMLGCAVLVAVLSLTAFLHWPWREALSPRLALTVDLTRIMLPYMVFICAAAFGMGVLNAFGKFAAPAMLPSILNVVWISALAALCLCPGLSTHAKTMSIACAILLAGLLQMAFMFRMMAKKGIAPRLTRKGWRDGTTRLVWHNMAIACIGAGAVQINYMLDQVLAQKANPWAAGVIGYADRLMELPLGVVGTAFGTVLLPTFSGFFAKADIDGAKNAFQSSVRNMLFVVLPCAAGLVVLAPELTSLIYKGGAFDDIAAVRVARAVACYSLGLAFFCLQKTLTPWFQAQKDMKTPLTVTVRLVFANAALNIASVWLLPVEWRHVGLAASTVLCAAAACMWLWILAVRRNGGMGTVGLAAAVAKMLCSALAMATVVHILRGILAERDFAAGAAVAMLVPVGAAVYFAAEFLFDRQSMRNIVCEFAGRRARRNR
ncbi:MAG: murein biosynthesis integral membrane protein MurJ [Kiritimatiellae bacterium]|nr:murein biosynthesis integral membrane protein MurJ [Kiritimatiellia bacterium]